MNNKFTFCFLASFSFLFFNCASVKHDFSLSQLSPIAIIGVNGPTSIIPVNPDGSIEPDDEPGSLSKTLNNFFGKNNPEIQTAFDRLQYSEEYLNRILEDIGGVTFISKENVVNSKTYKNATPGLTIINYKVPAEDYRVDMLSLSSITARSILRELNCNGLISADFDFYKKYDMEFSARSNSNITAVVCMTVSVFDQTGKKIIWKTFTAESSEKITVRGSVYDKEKLISLYPELIETVINNFVVKYMGE